MKKYNTALILVILSSLYPIKGYAIETSNLEIITIDKNKIAQEPRPITPRPSEFPDPLLPNEEEPSLEIPSTPSTPPTLSPDFPGKIIVEKFIFEGNTAFKDSELEEKIKDLIGKEITFAQLLETEQRITQLYLESGYINSGAVIPANQILDLQAAIVRIQIIEGTIKEIEITGTNKLRPNYIRNRLAIATKKPFNSNKLLEALQLLQLNPLIENISAELSAGIRPEASLLSVEVVEASSFNVLPFSNNGRTPSVGSFRRGTVLEEANLFGFGDRISLSYTNTDGSDAFDGNYTIPFNARNGTISISGGTNDTEVIEEPFNDLDLLGFSTFIDLSLRQPIIESPNQSFALGLTLSRQTGNTELLGEEFPLSRGANDSGETRIHAIRFFQDWTTRSSKDVLSLRSQFSLGLDIFDSTVNNDDLPDSRFFAWRNQGQYVRLLAEDTLFVVRSDIQLSTVSLLPLQQFSVGGFGSVRGYRQDFLLNDNGFFLSAEVRFPILRFNDTFLGENGLLQIVPFVDYGIGWNSDDFEEVEPNNLISVGFGLQLQFDDNFSFRVDWGIPLNDPGVDEDTLNENGVYLNLEWRLF